jgi:hypothetical protein
MAVGLLTVVKVEPLTPSKMYRRTSAFEGKADVIRTGANVRYWHFRDITRGPSCVRNTDHNGLAHQCPLSGVKRTLPDVRLWVRSPPNRTSQTC